MLSTTFSSASFSCALESIPKDADSPRSNAVSAKQRQIPSTKGPVHTIATALEYLNALSSIYLRLESRTVKLICVQPHGGVLQGEPQ